MSRAEQLQAFLVEFDGKPVTWGVDDCSAWPALWVGRETGKPVRLPRYANEAEALALKERHGLVALWDEALRDHPVYAAHDPRPGDVGIVQMSFGEVGMIFAHANYGLWRSEGGTRPLGPIRQRTILKVWALPDDA